MSVKVCVYAVPLVKTTLAPRPTVTDGGLKAKPDAPSTARTAALIGRGTGVGFGVGLGVAGAGVGVDWAAAGWALGAALGVADGLGVADSVAVAVA